MTEHRSVLYRGATVVYSCYGRRGAPAVVLIPGFLETRAAFIPLAEQWASRYRVLLVDVLGHGESGCAGYVHTMEDQADAVLAVLRAERIRFFKVAGHSMGGYIALALMDRVPDRIRGVLLLNTHPFADSEERRALRRRAMELAKKEKSSYLHAAIPALVAPENADRLREELRVMAEAARSMPVQGILAAQEGMMLRPDRSDLLHVLRPFPVVVVAGLEDPVIPMSTTETFWNLPGVTRRVPLPGGHLSFLEAGPEAISW
jgi:pimeloyl-ACP methyl ester carboxylesterase